MNGQTRRDFMARTATAAAALGAFSIMRGARGEDKTPLRIGLVGCGKRGVGAARNCLDAAENVTLVAMGDVFPDQMAAARKKMADWGDKNKLTDDTCFVGFDAAAKVINSDIDLVLLCTPPTFRPAYFRMAVEKGRHVFMEKPAAVCPAGVKSILETGELADKKKINVVAGTQRRHQRPYIDHIKRIQDGAIGEIVSAAAYWIGDYGYYPAVLRQDGWSDVEWQIRNWNYFTWLSGDHIVEQHVHNLDIMNWVTGAHPVKCLGMGGRQQRTGPEFGHIFDHFAIEFEYPGGLRVQSLCRQMADTESRVEEYIVGTLGKSNPAKDIRGKQPYHFKGENSDPYVQEHTDLINAIRTGNHLNEARNVAESSMVAIMGRMAAYTGQEVTWDWAMKKSDLNLMPPADLAFGDKPVEPVAIPGVTKLA